MLTALTSRCSLAAFLCVSTTVGFFSLLVIVFLVPMPEQSRDILQVMLGVVGTQWASIVGYFYGSSAGSARKTDMLNDLTGTGDGAGKTMTSATTKTEITKTISSETPPTTTSEPPKE